MSIQKAKSPTKPTTQANAHTKIIYWYWPTLFYFLCWSSSLITHHTLGSWMEVSLSPDRIYWIISKTSRGTSHLHTGDFYPSSNQKSSEDFFWLCMKSSPLTSIHLSYSQLYCWVTVVQSVAQLRIQTHHNRWFGLSINPSNHADWSGQTLGPAQSATTLWS